MGAHRQHRMFIRLSLELQALIRSDLEIALELRGRLKDCTRGCRVTAAPILDTANIVSGQACVVSHKASPTAF